MTQGNKIIRVGCASAFWGDTGAAAEQLVSKGQLDYLVFDYLAEMTMSIMAAAQLKNADAGFAPDFISTLKPLLSSIAEQNIKICSNAGGINAMGCALTLQKIIDEAGLALTIAVVQGDNLTAKQQELRSQHIKEMFTEQDMPERFTSINAYLGATTIAKAFDDHADIVITGRVVDSAVLVGPLVHEFAWSFQDYNLLAQASLAGHIIECGTQCTGGNFTDWHLVKEGYADMGFPIVECQADGNFVVTKVENTGGMVCCDTVAEQILYEIGDPCAYLLPDVICDFTQVKLHQQGKNRVLVTGAVGKAPSSQYKVSATYLDGFRSTATFLICGREATAKGQAVSDAIITRIRSMFKAKGFDDFKEVNIEILGSECTYGVHANHQTSREVVVKIAVHHANRPALNLFGAEIAYAATAMAPGITGLMGGRPKPVPRICLFSFLLNKAQLSVSYSMLDNKCLLNDKIPAEKNSRIANVGVRKVINVENTQQTHFNSQHNSQHRSQSTPAWQPGKMIEPLSTKNTITVPLISLAFARSGDKGNHCNVGVIARKEHYLAYIEAALNEDDLKEYFAHILAESSQIHIYQLPGLSAVNILIENSLGGGGMASLRIDPQGKAIAQQLLDMPINISSNIYQGGK